MCVFVLPKAKQLTKCYSLSSYTTPWVISVLWDGYSYTVYIQVAICRWLEMYLPLLWLLELPISMWYPSPPPARNDGKRTLYVFSIWSGTYTGTLHSVHKTFILATLLPGRWERLYTTFMPIKRHRFEQNIAYQVLVYHIYRNIFEMSLL